MKRLILLFALLLSCVSLCRYAYPPVPVVYGFLTDDYMDPNPATIANRQFQDYLFPEGWNEEYCYPDWYGGRYVRSLSDAPNGKLYLVIQIVRGYAYMEDEIHKIMAQAENAGYAFEYVPISFEGLYELMERCIEETEKRPAYDQDGNPIGAEGYNVNVRDSKVELTVRGDLKKFLGWKLYLKYLFHPHIRLREEPWAETFLDVERRSL